MPPKSTGGAEMYADAHLHFGNPDETSLAVGALRASRPLLDLPNVVDNDPDSLATALARVMDRATDVSPDTFGRRPL